MRFGATEAQVVVRGTAVFGTHKVCVFVILF